MACCARPNFRKCRVATRSIRAAWCRSWRSEEHTSELQSQSNLVCRLLLEKKKKKKVCQLLVAFDDGHFVLGCSLLGLRLVCCLVVRHWMLDSVSYCDWTMPLADRDLHVRE